MDKNNNQIINDNSQATNEKNASHKKALLWLAAFVVAFSLWFYVTSTVSEDVKYMEKNLVLDIEYEGIDVLDEYDIRNSDFDIISITVFGEESVVEGITKNDIRAYVDLSDEKIEESGTYKFDVKFDTGSIKGITCTSQSRDRIELTIDKMIPYNETVSAGLINLSAIKPDGYKFSDVSVNFNHIEVEGWSLDVAEIKYARIEPVFSGKISETENKAVGKIVLYNSAGQKIENDDFTVKAYKIGSPGEKEEVKDIEISFELIKEQ